MERPSALRALGGVVATVPLSAVIVVALLRIERIAGAYWFLPLYFFAIGLGNFLSSLGFLEVHRGAFLATLGGALLGNGPYLLLGIGLWAFRPLPQAVDSASSA